MKFLHSCNNVGVKKKIGKRDGPVKHAQDALHALSRGEDRIKCKERRRSLSELLATLSYRRHNGKEKRGKTLRTVRLLRTDAIRNNGLLVTKDKVVGITLGREEVNGS